MQFRNRKMVMPVHLNGAGNLFGGQALAWVDEETAVFAACQLGHPNIVTKFMSSIDFKAPAKSGDILEIGCDLVKFGRTSITVNCTIRNKTTKEDILLEFPPYHVVPVPFRSNRVFDEINASSV